MYLNLFVCLLCDVINMWQVAVELVVRKKMIILVANFAKISRVLSQHLKYICQTIVQFQFCS